jgi:hypothetical protein
VEHGHYSLFSHGLKFTTKEIRPVLRLALLLHRFLWAITHKEGLAVKRQKTEENAYQYMRKQVNHRRHPLTLCDSALNRESSLAKPG